MRKPPNIVSIPFAPLSELDIKCLAIFASLDAKYLDSSLAVRQVPNTRIAVPCSLVASHMDSDCKEGYAAAREAMSLVQLFTPAVSLGSCDSLMQHPAGLTHRIVEEKARASGGITAGLLRLSIGLEDPEDLWVDLQRALNGKPLALSAK